MPAVLYVVDAFTGVPFAGNPAAVCSLEKPANEAWMQNVAKEMNLAETAFLWPIDGGYSLRWFTPTVEVDLCGHATLASAFTLWYTHQLHAVSDARFETRSGRLTCRKRDEWVEMDFPALATMPCQVPESIGAALGWEPKEVFKSSMDYLVEVPTERVLRGMMVDMNLLAKLPARGVIVTCKSESTDFDFLSRFFAPAAGVNEDPVTGSAHCALGPYWKTKLLKNDFKAFQASERGGIVHLTVQGNRVILSGQAVMMSRIELFH